MSDWLNELPEEDYPTHRSRIRLFPPGLARVLAALGAVAVVVALAAWLADAVLPEHWSWLTLLVLAGVVNAALLAGVLWAYQAFARRAMLRERYQRELRYFRAWGGEEGPLRKTGLIRDLNDLGAVPENLEQALLPGVHLAGVNLKGCNLKEADLRGAVLQGADLEGADLWGADLSGANLNMANLQGANLRGANVRDANLVKVNLRGANLHRADLVGANLQGANLEMARLDKCRFALRMEAERLEGLHPSVEDAIRARLDAKGAYQERVKGR